MLLLHDPVTGRPRVPAGTLTAGVVGGVLADMVLTGQVRVVRGLVRPGTGLPIERLGRVVSQRVRSHPDRDVSYWLEHLDPVPGLVVARLVRARLIRQVRARDAGSWWRRSRILIPAGPGHSRWLARQVGLILTGPGPLTTRELVLAGLVDGTGLLPAVVHAAGPASGTDPAFIARARTRIRRAHGRAPVPGCTEICAEVGRIARGPVLLP